MGSSAKKKKEKKKDFQKPKFKVGKANAKASNFTDTSFRSKAITVNQQLPGANADDPLAQFKHHLALVKSRSDAHKVEGLKFLTSMLTAEPPYNPIGSLDILLKVLPLMSDSSSAVRSQQLKLLKSIPLADVEPYVEKIVLYIRAAMTNLSSDISLDAIAALEWLIDVVPNEVVSAPGCWMKPLNCFVSVLRWSSFVDTPANTGKGWTAAAPQNSLINSTKKQAHARQIAMLGRFLKVGLAKPETIGDTRSDEAKFLQNMYVAPKDPNAFSHLNVFGVPREEDDQMYLDWESRQKVFMRKLGNAVSRGIQEARKEGGSIGRAANDLDKVLRDGLDGYAESGQPDVEFSLKGVTALW